MMNEFEKRVLELQNEYDIDLALPGRIREKIVSDRLGHALVIEKRSHDAENINDSSIKYEYLTCKPGGAGSFDRMYNDHRMNRSLERISRNKEIFLAVFKNKSFNILRIYSVPMEVMLNDAKKRLPGINSNLISFSEKWFRNNGKMIWEV